MATTEDRLREAEHLEELWRQPSAKPQPARSDVPARGARAVRPTPNWSHSLLIAWVAVMATLFVFEPRPTNPTATPLWGEMVLLAFAYALLASMVGLASRRPWGLRASALAGGLGMVIAGACAVTGHHAGAWWVVEGLAFSGLATGSVAALRYRR